MANYTRLCFARLTDDRLVFLVDSTSFLFSLKVSFLSHVSKSLSTFGFFVGSEGLVTQPERRKD